MGDCPYPGGGHSGRQAYVMDSDRIAAQLTEGTVLEGPHFGEPVRVLLAKARGGRVEIVAEGVTTKQTWTKLQKAEEFYSAVTIKSRGG